LQYVPQLAKVFIAAESFCKHIVSLHPRAYARVVSPGALKLRVLRNLGRKQQTPSGFYEGVS
jgi:hypothetical protein